MTTGLADSPTRKKILYGALRNLALFGADRVSMSGVADAAGVSRGTVYRYFTGRDELLDALGELMRDIFERGVNEAAAGGRDTREKLQRILDSRLDRESRQAIRRLRELQPGFTLDFYTKYLPNITAIYKAALAENFDAEASKLSLDDLADVVTRITVTETLFDDDSEHITTLMMSLWDTIHESDRFEPRLLEDASGL